MKRMKYKIGTRGSRLAVAQAKEVCEKLKMAYPKEEFELQIVKTKGDVILDKPLHEIGDKGVFVKEIEEKLLSKEIQIGVHSMKDMPSKLAEGLIFAKAWKREDPRDVLILREKKSLEELPAGAVIGTGSKRREFQLKRIRQDLKVVGIRGNVETRLRKMEEEKLDGIILAAAGLIRLGKQDKITQYLSTKEMIPAPAQGILALELLQEDEKLLSMLNALSDEETEKTARVERGFLHEIGGSCHLPIGAVCRMKEDGLYSLSAMYGNETGTKQAYVNIEGNDMEEVIKKAAAKIREQAAGKVILVGAGTGDAGLITVKGLSELQKADCIVYDRLASPSLLDEAKDGCELIYAGKENHHHTMRQEEMNRLLVLKSMEHERIVRLKGGDAYVFGRGGEEGLFLREHGVPFEVIPGISSCIAGPAYAGIPITHRGMSIGFHVVTAHDRRDELADIDFCAMVKGTETCVFLMGLGKIGEIADRLMEAGMPKHTPVAVISHAASPEQKTCVSDLEHIAGEVTTAGLTSPAVIVVGKVVSLRKDLNFFETRPLSRKRYLIPKIGKAPTRLRELLLEQGAFVQEIQVGEIIGEQRRFLAEDFSLVDWLIFTSKNGVEEFFKNFAKSGLDMRTLAGCKIAAIGRKTADVLKNHGIIADFVPNDFHSDAFITEFKRRLTGKETVWYFKARNADSHLKEELSSRCQFEEIIIYENCAVEPEGMCGWNISDYDGVIFTCASSAERFMRAAGNEFGDCRVYSIGKKTTAYLKEHGVETVIEAKNASYEGIVESLAEGYFE